MSSTTGDDHTQIQTLTYNLTRALFSIKPQSQPSLS